MIKKKKLVYLFLIISIYLLTFQYFLENNFTIFKYTDEFYAFLFFPVFLFKIMKDNFLIKEDFKLIGMIIFMLILGIIPNLIYNYQTVPYVVMDIILFLKFFFAIGLSKYLFNYDTFEESNNAKLKKHIRFIILILFISTILNYMFHLWPSSNIRFSIMTNQIFFGHPTKLAAILFFLLTLYNIIKKGKTDVFNFLIYIMIFTTLRMKALLSLVICLFVIYYVNKKQNKINIKKLGILGVIICLLGLNTFKFYFLSDGFARAELLRTSFIIAHDYFPFGTGFGTFGSWPSGVSYSPIYLKYGLNEIWGITPYNYLAIADSFWPTVLGQFGYIGMLLYILIIIKLFNNIQKEFNEKLLYVYSSKLMAFVYLLISSTSESAFFNQLSIPLGIIIGLNFHKK